MLTNGWQQRAVGHFWLTSCYCLFVCLFVHCRKWTWGLILKRKIKHITYCNELCYQLSLLSALRVSKRTPIQIQGQRMGHRNTHMSWKCFKKSSGMRIRLQDNSRILCNRENRISLHAFTFCQSLPTAVVRLSQNPEMWALTASMSQAWVHYWYCPCPQPIQKYSCNAWSSVPKLSSSCNPEFMYLCIYITELGLGLG